MQAKLFPFEVHINLLAVGGRFLSMSEISSMKTVFHSVVNIIQEENHPLSSIGVRVYSQAIEHKILYKNSSKRVTFFLRHLIQIELTKLFANFCKT